MLNFDLTVEDIREPLPSFSKEQAEQKIRMAEDAWNMQNPEKIATAYSLDSQWRNRDVFLKGRAEIVSFLTAKWQKENQYRLIKELWAYSDDHIAVRFTYEWHDDQGQWYRSYGNENWAFNERGLMQARHASINDVAISEDERLFHWPLGRRPDDHQGLTELGL
tara:strand:- start:1079 stop:1570 length:492 start_codon:yes stop_codon:yes gene_type:complete